MTSPAYNNAWTMMQDVLQQWGLESLGNVVKDMLTAGDTADVIPIKLRATKEYKTRFSGNELRQKAGLPALSEAQYLATETTYKDLVRQYVGTGQYDTKDNFDKWFSSDISPQELNVRFQTYQQAYQQSPQSWKEAWASHGFTPQDAVRAVMDPAVTETDLKRNMAAYSIGGEAVQAYGKGYDFNVNRAMDLANHGVSQQQAQKVFGDVAARENTDESLFRMNADQTNRTQLEDEGLLNNQDVARRRNAAYDAEKARFSGNPTGTLQGALNRDASGQY